MSMNVDMRYKNAEYSGNDLNQYCNSIESLLRHYLGGYGFSAYWHYLSIGLS